MDRPSSLSLSKSMRESGYPALEIVYLDWCGTFVTYDHLALRVWDLKGQLKCIHHDKSDSELKLIKLSPIPSLQKFMIIYSTRSPKDENKCGKIRVYSELLSIVQEIELGLPKLEKVILSPDYRSLIILDSTKTASILYIDQKGSEFDYFYSQLGKPVNDDDYRPRTSKLPLSSPIKLRNIQQIDCAGLSLVDILPVDNNVLFILTMSSILVLTRPKLQKDKVKTDLPSMLKNSPKRRKSRMEQDPEAEAKKLEEAKYPFHEFSHTATIRFNYEVDVRKPQKLTKLDKHLMSLLFDDGWMDVIQFSTYSTCREPEKRISKPNMYETMVVTSFQVYTPNSNANNSTKTKTISAPPATGSAKKRNIVQRVIEATNCNTYGTEGYSSEFFTVDKDFRIIHWALRPLSLYSDSFDGYSLASTSLLQDSQSQAPSVDDGVSSVGTFPIAGENNSAAGDKESAEVYSETLDLVQIHFIALQQPLTQRMLPDFLGDIQLHDEAKVNPAVATSKPGYGSIHLSFLELRNANNKPVSKHLIGAYDGMILLFDIKHPQFTIREWTSLPVAKKAGTAATTKKLTIEDARSQDLYNTIVQAVRGPDMSSIDNHFITEGEATIDPKGGVSTLLLMKKEQLELMSMRDGSVLRSYSLHNLREQFLQRTALDQSKGGATAKSGTKLSNKLSVTKGRLADDLATSAMEKDLEGEVSFIHFCPYTHWIFVGYSSGTVGAFSLNEQGVQEAELGFTYLKTNSVHSNTITYLRTFPFLYNHVLVTDHLDPIKPKQITVLFVGDSSGQFTLWQVHPKRTDARALCFQSRQHMGRICSATVCYVPHGKITHDFAIAAQSRFHELNSNHNILVTACERGLVHAWRIEQTLQLHLISFFHTTRFPVRMTSCLALPKMVYREFLVPNPDAPESMFSSLLDDPNKDRNPEFQAAAATLAAKSMDEEDDGGRKTAASTYPQKDVSQFIPMANLCYEIYCVLGFGDGQTEIWSLSSDPRYCTLNALYSKKHVDSAIVSHTLYSPDIYDGIIHEPTSSIMHEFTLINLPKLEGDAEVLHQYHYKPDDIFITAHRNGNVQVSRLKVNPVYTVEEWLRIRDKEDYSSRFFVETLVYFQTPQSSVVSLVPLQPNHVPIGVSDYDVALVSDFGVYQILPMVSKQQLIPAQWHQNQGSLQDEYDQFGKKRRPYRTTRLSTDDILSLHSETSFTNDGDVFPAENAENSATTNHSKLQRGRTSSTASMLQLTDATPTTIQEAVQDMLNQPDTGRSGSTASRSKNGDRLLNNSLASESLLSASATSLLDSSTSQKNATNNSNNKRQYVGPMETMQRIVSSDLHVMKKDKRLLELFTFEMDQRESSVTADTAIDIICQWTNENRPKLMKNLPQASETSTELDVRRENLQELFKILELNSENRLKFIEVAKIAAITASAMRKAAEINQQKFAGENGGGGGGLSMSASAPALQTYQNMKTTVTKVTYNAMGERVIEKKKMQKAAMGIVDGSYQDLRKTIYEHVAVQKKIDHDIQKSMTHVVKLSRKLQKIPAIFQDLLAPQRLPLRCPEETDPSHWCEDSLHYFDVARTVRIARAVLDLRCGKQHELLHNQKSAQSLFTAHPDSVESIPKLTITYFERQYGECSRSMNVSRYKISNFLEACMQYEYFPLVKLLQYINQLDAEYATAPGFQVAVWLVVEARNMLLSRGSVIHGEAIDKYEKLTSHDDLGDQKLLTYTKTVGEPSNRIVRFQYVTMLEATMVCDEMLRVRGKFGPDFYMPILEQITRIPTKTREQCLSGDQEDQRQQEEKAHEEEYTWEKKENSAMNSPPVVKEEDKLLDLEGFLEELFRLFIVHVTTVKSLDNRIFGEASLNVAVTALPREINRAQTQSRLLIMDDDAAGFGPFHAENMSKIRSFLHLCIQHDPLRIGTIDEKELLQHFRTIFLVSAPTIDTVMAASEKKTVSFSSNNENNHDQNPLSSSEEMDNIALQRFYRALQTRLKLNSVQDDASYVDILAILFTWEEMTQGSSTISVENMTPIIPKLERLVEIHLINDLIRYLTKVSTREDVTKNPVWVMGALPGNGTTNLYFTSNNSNEAPVPQAKPSLLLSLPMDGEWHMNVKPAENDHVPGMLYTAPAPRIPYHVHTLDAVKRLHHRVPYTTISWFTKEDLPAAPQVMSNQREMRSVLGETVRLQSTKDKKTPAPIRVTTMDSALDEVGKASAQAATIPPPPHTKELADKSRNIRTSYSRMLNSMQVVPVGVTDATALESRPSSPLSDRNITTADLPIDAGLQKIYTYLIEELQLDTETAAAAMSMIMEQFQSQQQQQQSPSPDWQRRLWSLLTSHAIATNGGLPAEGPRAVSLEDSVEAGGIGEAALLEQSLSKLLLQGSHSRSTDQNENKRPSAELGEDQENVIGKDEADDDDDDDDTKNLPYRLLRQNSSNSNDSNYQEYALEMTKQQQQQHLQQQQQQQQHQSSEDMLPSLPPITRRPVTNEVAALTPFLDFKVSDFFMSSTSGNNNRSIDSVSKLPNQPTNSVANFLMSSSLQEFLQLDDPNSGSNGQNNNNNLQSYHPSLSQAHLQSQQHPQQQPQQFVGDGSMMSTSLNFQGTQSLSEMNRSLASDEIHRRILHLQELEEKFATMYDLEKDEFKRREIEKQRLREMIRREMLLKQREGMRYYKQALEKRGKFLASGRAQLADALAKELEDKQAKEREIQRILDLNRAKIQERQDQKKKDELAQLQRDKEEKERDLMRKEEKLTIKFETIAREERRRQMTADKAKADAEWAEQMKAVQAMAMALNDGSSLGDSEANQDNNDGDALTSKGRVLKSRGGEEDDEEEDENKKNKESEGDALAKKPKGSMFDNLMNDGDGKGLDEDDDKGDDDEEAEEEEEEEGDNSVEQASSTADNTRPSTTMAVDAIQFFKSSNLEIGGEGEAGEEEEYLTPIEKRIRLLLANMKSGAQLLQSHPRKNGKSKQAFFFPQMFSADISFNPFQNISDELAQKFLSPNVPEVGPEEIDPVEVIFDPFTMAAPIEIDLFADINTAVKKYRKDLDAERRSLLNTKLGDIKLEEFLPVFRTGSVDWLSFFRLEKKRLKTLKQRMIAAAEQEAHAFDFDPDDFSAMMQSMNNGSSTHGKDSSIMEMISLADESSASLLGPNFGRGNRPLKRPATSPFNVGADDDGVSQDGGNDNEDELHIPKTILQVLPKDPKRDIIPLPFGKVKQHQVVFPGQLKFYQMEVPHLDTIVTVEVKSSRGLASVFMHYNKLPSTVKFEEKANCTKENNRWARLSFSPKITGSYFLAVTSLDSGAEFEIWAYSTGESSEPNARLQQVDQVLKKWRYILKHSDEELQIHYPRISQEGRNFAEEQAKEEASVMLMKKQVIREMQKIRADNKLDTILQQDPILPAYMQPKSEEEKNDIMAEVENVEAFVVKVGRYAMRREREMKQYRQMLIMKSNAAAGSMSLNSNSQDSQDSTHRNNHHQNDTNVTTHASADILILSPRLDENIEDEENVVKKTVSSDTVQTFDNEGNPMRKSLDKEDATEEIDHSKNQLQDEGLVPDALSSARGANKQSSVHPLNMNIAPIITAVSTDPRDYSSNNINAKQMLYQRQRRQMGDEYDVEDDGVFADENPNQHADLFSTPTTHRVASLAMFAPMARDNSSTIAESKAFQSVTPSHRHQHHRNNPLQQALHNRGSPSHHNNTTSDSHPAIPNSTAASIDNENAFKQELQRVISEEQAASDESAANAHSSFALPALNIKYQGSDLQFEKDFHAKTPKVNRQNSTNLKLPPIAGSGSAPDSARNANNDHVRNINTAMSNVTEESNEEESLLSRNLSREAASQQKENDEYDDNHRNSNNNEEEEEDDGYHENNEAQKPLLLSSTMPLLHDGTNNTDHGDYQQSATTTRPLQYSFSAADIREQRRMEKLRKQMLPPELRSTPKPVSYALRMDQKIPEKWTSSATTNNNQTVQTGKKLKKKGMTTGSSLELENKKT